jgi:hypothetical protein
MTEMAANPAPYFDTVATLEAKRKVREEKVLAAKTMPVNPTIQEVAAKPMVKAPRKARRITAHRAGTATQ